MHSAHLPPTNDAAASFKQREKHYAHMLHLALVSGTSAEVDFWNGRLRQLAQTPGFAIAYPRALR